MRLLRSLLRSAVKNSWDTDLLKKMGINTKLAALSPAKIKEYEARKKSVEQEAAETVMAKNTPRTGGASAGSSPGFRGGASAGSSLGFGGGASAASQTEIGQQYGGRRTRKKRSSIFRDILGQAGGQDLKGLLGL